MVTDETPSIKMRTLIAIAFIAAFSAIAEPAPHAVLTDDLSSVATNANGRIETVLIEPGLVAAYRDDPSKAAKVARLRLLVDTPSPAPTIQEVVEPGGWAITETNVTRLWNVRAKTPQEIAGFNAAQADGIQSELARRIAGTNWAGMQRITSLQSEMLGEMIQVQLLNCELLLLVTKAVSGTAATNNLTVSERARVGSLRTQLAFSKQPDFTEAERDRVVLIRDELIKAYQLWVAARDARQILANTNVAIEASDSSFWPELEIAE